MDSSTFALAITSEIFNKSPCENDLSSLVSAAASLDGMISL